MDADPEPGQSPAPVLLVEDDPLVGRAYARHFASRGTAFEWCTTVQAGRERLLDGSRAVPGAVILDLDLPDGRGEELLPVICKQAPRSKVLAVSGYLNGALTTALLRRGVFSVMKPVGAAHIAALIFSLPLALTEPITSAEISREEVTGDRASRGKIKGLRRTNPESAVHRQLVLEHLLAGKSNREIAEALTCTIKNVEYHVAHFLKKHGCSSRLQLVVGLRSKRKRSAR